MTLILLSNGLDPKQKDSFGQVSYSVLVVELEILLVAMQTPVHSTCITGDLSCLELLMEYVRNISGVCVCVCYVCAHCVCACVCVCVRACVCVCVCVCTYY